MLAQDQPVPATETGTQQVPDAYMNLADLESILASCARPFVLAGEREISVLRRGLTKDGWKRSLYLQPAEKQQGIQGIYVGAGLLSVANQSLDLDARIPARSGHFHHFFCDCGSMLEIPHNLEIAESYVCPTCGRKYSGERYDGAVRGMQHSRLARAAISCALVYAIEKDQAYADKVAEILTGYARTYPGPHTGPTEGGILYQSLDEAVWIIPLAQAYDLIYYSRSLSDEQKRLVEEKLFRPVAEGLRNMGILGNWGSWHLSAVGVVGLAIKDAELLQYALDSFRSQITNQLGDDGLWPESVHTYHFYPLSAFVHLAEGCCRAGIDIYNWEVKPGKSLKKMFLAPLSYAYPSFRLPAINDGWYDSFLPTGLYEIAYRRWNEPIFAWVLKTAYKFGTSPINSDQQEHSYAFARKSFYAFLFGRDLPGGIRSPQIKSRDFPSLGICTLRDNDEAMATFDYGPLLSHGHLDKLSFTFYANDTLVVPDYGTPGYGSKIAGWYVDTPAHNTVVVDGKSQKETLDRSLVSHYTGDYLQVAEAVSDEHYPGILQKRSLVLVEKTLIVTDKLVSESEHEYDWMARFEGELKGVSGKYVSSEFDAGRYSLIDIDQAYHVEGPFRIDWICNGTQVAFAIWTLEGSVDVAVGSCPAETASRRVPIVVARKSGKEARFVSLFSPSNSEMIDLKVEGAEVTLSDGRNADHIYLREFGVAANVIDTDGDIAVVRTCRSATQDQETSETQEKDILLVALIRGSYVSFNGEVLIECPSKVECVEVSFVDRTPSIKYCSDTAGTIKLQTNARAMRINGHRTSAMNIDGLAQLRVTSQMLNF
ncbi:MAG: heparinase II/III family protein [Armatimonadetes bacterium]|nr:heparinase II/III family protein [Armatimonadota bacterium]